MRDLPSRVRDALPRPLRNLIGGTLRYTQRLGRWLMILWQVRGASWRDEIKLVASAAAAPLTSLRNLSRWQDPVLLFDARVRISGVGTFHVRRHSDDLWHVLPWRERYIHRALRRLLGPDDIFVDAGANIGVYTLLASRLIGPRGRVLAIEMMPDTAAILRRHVAENGCGNVEIVEKALSDRAGEILTASVPLGRYGQASIANSATGAFEEHQVQTATLDDVCREYGRIRLLKLDVEGAELQAIAGAGSTLGRTDKVIYESHTSAGDLTQAFERGGFRLSQILGKDRLAERANEANPSRPPTVTDR